MKAAIFVAYLWVDSWDSDIIDPQLAIMPPPYFHSLILIGEYDMYCLFSHDFSGISFHDKIGLIRLLVGEHFNIAPILEADHIRE